MDFASRLGLTFKGFVKRMQVWYLLVSEIHILICMYSDYRLFEIEPSGIQNVGVIFALYRMFTNVQ